MVGEKPTYVDVLPLNCYNAFIYLIFIYYRKKKKTGCTHKEIYKFLAAYNLKDKGL